MGKTIPGGLFLAADGKKFVNAKNEPVEPPTATEEKAVDAPPKGGAGKGTGAAGTLLSSLADYPGAEALERAGLTTLEAVAAKSDDELLAVPGIGGVTLERIRAFGK